MPKSFLLFPLLLCAALISGCETIDSDAAARSAMNEAIRTEQPGNYFIGRRMYKKDYKVWGWVREPGQPWRTAKLVMLNEQKVLAPDRQQGKIGTDHNYEYRLQGYFSGASVYEPASDRIYPEFILTGYEVRSVKGPNIYKYKKQMEPSVRILDTPM